MLNWQGWAANFLGWATSGDVTPPPAAPVVGGGMPAPKRKKRKHATVIYKDRAYVVPDGAEQAFVQALLDAEPVPKKIRPLPKPAPLADEDAPPLPTWAPVAWPEYPHLLAEFQRQQADEMLAHLDAIVRARVQMLEDDDEDVLLLLT